MKEGAMIGRSWLLFIGLLCLGSSAHAIDLYEFEGYFVSNNEGSDPTARFSAGHVGERFEGWVVYDGERHFPTEDGDWHYAAPLVSVYLETSSGYTISSTNNDGGIGLGSEGDVDVLGYSVRAVFDEFIYVAGSPFHGSIGFRWSSTEKGQLPEEFDPGNSVGDLGPVHFRPNKWTLEVSITPQCSESVPCNPHQVSTLKGHISRFGPRPKSITHEQFAVTPADWTPSAGAWLAENGYYRNVANVAFTHSIFNGAQTTSEYDVNVVLASQWGAPGNTFGLLLEYRDSANFDELRLNASGGATYTRVTRGIRTVLRTGSYPSRGPQTAFSLTASRRGNSILVRRGATEVFTVDVGALRGGQVGLFASWNQARFYEFTLNTYGQWPIAHSDFATSMTDWTPVAGTWAPVDGYLLSSSNMKAAIATGEAIFADEYTVDTSLLLEWSNTGNQGGLVYDYVDSSNYRAVLVACGTCRPGVAAGPIDVIEVVNGVRRIVLSRGGPAALGPNILPREWTTVGVRRIGELTEITVHDVVIVLKQRTVVGTKRAGLIARFNRVRFDDVVVGVAP
jgi:hypothetical protein